MVEEIANPLIIEYPLPEGQDELRKFAKSTHDTLAEVLYFLSIRNQTHSDFITRLKDLSPAEELAGIGYLMAGVYLARQGYVKNTQVLEERITEGLSKEHRSWVALLREEGVISQGTEEELLSKDGPMARAEKGYPSIHSLRENGTPSLLADLTENMYALKSRTRGIEVATAYLKAIETMARKGNPSVRYVAEEKLRLAKIAAANAGFFHINPVFEHQLHFLVCR